MHLFLSLIFLSSVAGGLSFFSPLIEDVFLHNPRGANNRNSEANVNNQNSNRLYDSQNNAKGGYCLGPAMSYYEEWTGHHGCNNRKIHCNYVLQYMCSRTNEEEKHRLRDGTTTNGITADENGPVAKDGDGNLLYALHETYEYYQDCSTRNRNGGLWISDRYLNQQNARSTRQNNNGNRRGFECPEERDYYPYWHPSPWRDIAVLTDHPEFCPLYIAESQNVKAKNYCYNTATGRATAPNNQAECVAEGFSWTSSPAFGIPPPECLSTTSSRENEHAFGNTYLWTLPTSQQESCITNNNCNCALRIRYNVTAGDFPGGYEPRPTLDHSKNGEDSPFKEDPFLSQDGLLYSMAVYSIQVGRVFQDRSHMFHIRPRPTGVAATDVIHNLNVAGKRGNIVQAYPGIEYKFSPDDLVVNSGDYIHFQWTGCDTNPAGNAGEGAASTDRTNIVQVASPDHIHPASDAWLTENPTLLPDAETRKLFGQLGQTDCLSWDDLLDKNDGNENAAEQDIQNCMKLNAAGAYFDGGLVQMNTAGSFYFISTRNNNFSNRQQTGIITVHGESSSAVTLTVSLASLFAMVLVVL